MEIVQSTIRSSRPIKAQRVERDLVVEFTAGDLKTARREVIFRLENDHPEAHFDVLSHEVIERPRSGSGGAGIAFWSNPGKYRFHIRASGLLEQEA